jgi:C4-dicarboxylate-specific signal transduction histidine kinase
LLSDYLTAPGGSGEAGLLNTAISIAAIVTTTFLALKIESATAAMYEARSQLAHVGRIAVLGELTASIAHEVNQPLAATVINGNACLRWLAAEPPNLPEARQAVESIVKDANRAADIITRLRALTQRKPGVMTRFGINDAIRDTVSLAENEIRSHHIALQMHLAADLPQVKGDRVQLQQVVLNLIVNAVDAINLTSDGLRELTLRSEPAAPESLLVSVEDTGPGLAKDQVDRLFEPFYTSKAGGMGMGLAISRSIIESHGGQIWAESKSPRGAIFRFRLPIEQG